MAERTYPWTRFWVPREGQVHLDLRGYLQDPESRGGKLLNPQVVPLTALADVSCLVLLGEPGAGKTKAVADERGRDEAQMIAVSGACIRLDLRDVASARELSIALGDQPAWKKAAGPLCLVLDSLDETPIGADALARPLLEALDGYRRQDLRLRLVSRTAELPEALEHGLVRRWPKMKVYEIAPLRRIDVERAAQAHGLDPAKTLETIAEREVEPFAQRPVTLRFVLNQLAAGKSLPRSKRELYDRFCRSLCEEPSATRSKIHVSPDERLVFAERIAASLLFGAKTAVFIDPDHGDVPDTDVPIRQLVGDQERIEGELFARATEPAIREALGTALFTARGRGRLSFAHHTFAEFLAARYVSRRRLPLAQARALLVHAGLDRIVPPLHGVAAWLASMDAEFFDFVLQRDPQVLLDADGSMFDEDRKRRLTKAILRRYAKREQLDRDPFRRQGFGKLAYGGIARILRPYIRKRGKEPSARGVAIEIAMACQVASLGPLLLAVAKDRKDDLQIRSAATYALTKLAGAALAKELRPLAAEPDATDRFDDLKGNALRALWPGHLRTAELLSLITPARKPFHVGAYQVFLEFELPPRATDEDLLLLLDWTANQGSRNELREPAKGLVTATLNEAWKRLDEPRISRAYTLAVVARLREHDLPIIIDRVLDEDPWTHDEAKRRELLRALLPVADKSGEGLLRFGELLRDGDFYWLLSLLGEPLELSARTFLLAWLHGLVAWGRPFEVIDPVATASLAHPDLAEALEPVFEAWPVDGPDAKQARAAEARLKGLLAQRRRPTPRSPALERVRERLDRFDAGDEAAYWPIDQELGFCEKGYQELTNLKSDLTELPGWKLLDEATRRRLVQAAAKYLVVGKCSPESWLGQGHEWNPALAGYRALRLVGKEDRATLDALPSSVWRKWAPIIAAFPGLDEAKARDHGLLAVAHRHVATEVLNSIVATCVGEHEYAGYMSAQRRLEPIWDDRAAIALLDLLQRPLKPQATGELLDQLLRHRAEGAVEVGLSWLTLPLPKGAELERMKLACVSLLRLAIAQAWPRLWQVLEAEPEFGREVLIEAANDALGRRQPITSPLSEAACVDFLLWLEEQAPAVTDPDDLGFGRVGPRQQVADR